MPSMFIIYSRRWFLLWALLLLVMLASVVDDS